MPSVPSLPLPLPFLATTGTRTRRTDTRTKEVRWGTIATGASLKDALNKWHFQDAATNPGDVEILQKIEVMQRGVSFQSLF